MNNRRGLALAFLLTGCAALWVCGSEKCRAAAPEKPIRGVVLFVGDGMGVATVTAARIHKGSLEGLEIPASASLAVDRAPRVSLVRTWSTDCLVTDSAAGITAMVAGKKVANGVLSAVSSPDGESSTPLRTVLEIAEAAGMSTGIVTTSRITHATPAGTYTHRMNRSEEIAIAADLVPGPEHPELGNGIEVVLGGGSSYFHPSALPGFGGKRRDGRDLIAEMETAGYRPVNTGEALRNAVAAGEPRILGLFAESHMTYEADRLTHAPPEPSLAEMTAAAISVLNRNPRGFFLLVEGGRIDHALHENYGYRAVREMLAFDAALEEALLLDPEETVIVVTADHDHTMVIAGYAPATADVFSQAGVDADGVPYASLQFANGPGALTDPPKWFDEDTLYDPDRKTRAGLPMSSDTHGGMDVPLYLFGPPRYQARVGGTMENTGVYDILRAGVLER